MSLDTRETPRQKFGYSSAPMPLYERLSPRFRPKRELRPQGSRAGRGARRPIDAVLCGHRHYDLADAPRTAPLTKAKLDDVGRLVGALSPQLVVPMRHGAFFAPFERALHLLPGIDVEGFVVPPSDARGAVLAAG